MGPLISANNPSVLIVEDNGLIALMLQEFLTRYGYEVPPPVASGEEAIEYLRFSVPDLILMDITLDGRIDGIETARQIQKISEVPVIFLSAHQEENRIAREGKITRFGYITKPFILDDVLLAVGKMVHRNEPLGARDFRPKALIS